MPFSDLPANLHLRFASYPDAETGLAMLSAAEHVRLARYSHPDRRRGFVLGRMVARSLLAEHVGSTPQEAPLAVEESGALAVDGHDLFLSVSHAGKGDAAQAVAALAARPVGVDLEPIVSRRPDLYQRILNPEEYPILSALSLEHDEAQVLLWSLKEAVLKGLGTGFRRGARSIRLHDVKLGRGTASDGEQKWALRYMRREDFWVTVALAEEESAL